MTNTASTTSAIGRIQFAIPSADYTKSIVTSTSTNLKRPKQQQTATYKTPAKKESAPIDLTTRNKLVPQADELLRNVQMKKEVFTKLDDIFNNFIDFYKEAYKTEQRYEAKTFTNAIFNHLNVLVFADNYGNIVVL